jgi:hypothetical protein
MLLQALLVKEAYDRCDDRGKAAFLGTMEYFATSVVIGAAVGAIGGAMMGGAGGALIGACVGGPVLGPIGGTAVLAATLVGRGLMSLGGSLMSSVAQGGLAAANLAADIYDKRQRRAEFQAFGMDAKTASLVAETLKTASQESGADLRKFHQFSEKMRTVHAEMGDNGQSYIVSFTTSKGRQGAVSAMTPEQFDQFKAKVAKSDTPVTITTFGKDSIKQECMVHGDYVRFNPRKRDDWVPGMREVRLDQEVGTTLEQAVEALGDVDATLATCTFFDENGQGMGREEAEKHLQRSLYRQFIPSR